MSDPDSRPLDAATAPYIQRASRPANEARGFGKRSAARIISIAVIFVGSLSLGKCDGANSGGSGYPGNQSVSGLFPCGPERWNSVPPLFRLFVGGNV